MLRLKSPISKFLSVAFVILISSTALLLGFAPALLSTKWGNACMTWILNQKLPGKVSVKQVAISWFGPQHIEGLTFVDPNGETVLRFDSFDSDAPLLSLLNSDLAGRKIRIAALHAALKMQPNGRSNLEETLGWDIPALSASSHDLQVTDVDFEMNHTGWNGRMSLKTTGVTKLDGTEGQFEVDLLLNGASSSCRIDIRNYPSTLLDHLVGLYEPKGAGLIEALIGKAVNLKVTQENQNGEVEWLVQSESDKASLLAQGAIKDGVLLLTNPARIRLHMNPVLFQNQMNFISSLHGLHLHHALDLNIDLDEFTLPVALLNSDASLELMNLAAFSGRLTIPQLELNQFKLKNPQIAFNSLKSSSAVTLSSSADVRILDSAPFKLRCETLFENPFSGKGGFDPRLLLLNIDNCPVELIEGLMRTEELAGQYLGKTLSASLAYSSDKSNILELSLISDNLYLPALELSLDNSRLNPAALFEHDLSGSVRWDRLSFLDASGNPESSLHSTEISWKLAKHLQRFDIDFTGLTASPGQGNGHFKGRLFMDKSQGVSLSDSTIVGSFQADRFPAHILSYLSRRQEFEPIFGPSLALRMDIHLRRSSGHFEGSIQGPTGQAALNASIANGTITLNEPFHLATQSTPRLGQLVLSRLTPAFKELVGGEGGLEIAISPEDFSIPLDFFNFEQWKIGHAAVNLGKLVFHNRGDVKNLISMLRPARSELISVWATPAYFKMEHGALTVFRTDVLILDRYPIAAWGKINLAKDEVKMTLGLSGTALSHALDLPNLERSTMVQLPINGSIKNAKIDTSKASAKIGALIAQQSGSPQGIILGTVLDLAKGKEGPIPPPTTSPLPWEGKIYGEDTALRTEPSRKVPNDKNKPFKEITNEAKSFLRGLFKK